MITKLFLITPPLDLETYTFLFFTFGNTQIDHGKFYPADDKLGLPQKLRDQCHLTSLNFGTLALLK